MRSLPWLLLLALGFSACATADEDAPSELERTYDARFDAWSTPSTLPQRGTIVSHVTDVNVLGELEDRLGFAPMLLREEGRPSDAAQHNRALTQASRFYASLVRSLQADIASLGERGAYSYGAPAYVNRLFHKDWLVSPYAFYDLVAVVARVDRMDFHADGCGELRFIYRLAYNKTNVRPAVSSRMPMTLNAVYAIAPGTPKEECSAVVSALRVERELQSTQDYADWLAALVSDASPLSPRFAQLEVNLQVARLPAENKQDFGGHAEYLLRIFRPDTTTGELALYPLENTPDVERISASPELRAELAAYLVEHVAEIDRGTFTLPERFLATRATSFSTQGAHRLANHPYRKLLTASMLSDASFQQTQLLASADGMIARLDDMTCQGCHQSRSVAGFHVLGEDRGDRTHPINALRLPTSPHFTQDDARRAQYVADVIDNFDPEHARPLSYAPFAGPARAGDACLTQADAAHFKTMWSCAEGLLCRNLATTAHAPNVGLCVRPDNRPVAGDPCMTGSIVDDARNPRSDRRSNARFGCSGYACLAPIQGTPLGLCYAACGPGDTARNDDEVCAYNGGAGFDACAATGNFAQCVGSNVRRGLRAACDEQTPCRDDYICQQMFHVRGSAIEADTEARGFCVPTYFIYQMRLDGHPQNPL